MKVKKLLAIALVLVMVLGTMNLTVFAEGEVTPLGYFTYSKDDGAKTVTLTKYNNAAPTVVVPGTYNIDGTDYAVIINSLTTFKGNTSITSVTLSEGVTFKDNTMKDLFNGCTKLATVDLTQISTTGVENMSYMFYRCLALTTLDLSNFDTSSVTDMSCMFGCLKGDISNTKLSSINLTGFDTSSVTTFDSLFENCGSLTEIIGYEDFNTQNLESLRWTFDDINSKTLDPNVVIDISKWDLSNLKTSACCFQNCRASEIKLPDNIPVMNGYFLNHTIFLKGSSFTIPASVKKIGYAHTFYDMGDISFNEFKVEEGNTNYVAIDGIIYSTDGTEILGVPRGKTFTDGTYEIREGVTFIPELVFSRNTNLKKIVLPNSYVMRQCIYLHDSQYTTEGDEGNVNGTGNALALATYMYTGVTDYEVKNDNPRYKTENGLLYSKDMSTLLAIPVRYDRRVEIPEGVTKWENCVMWTWPLSAGSPSAAVDRCMIRSSGVDIPASMTNIDYEQMRMLNRLEDKNGKTEGLITGFDNTLASTTTNYTWNFTINVDEDNPVYRVNTSNGHLEAYAITENDITLSQDAFVYDGTAKEPEVTVTLNGAALTKGTDYSVSYSNNTNPGTATVTVTGLNGYSSYNATKTFKIGGMDAQIGDSYYSTLADAVAAANAMAGDATITLLKDITFNEMYSINNNITIDGGNYTLTRGDTYKGKLFTVNAGKTLILNNLTIDGNNNWTLDYDAFTTAAAANRQQTKAYDDNFTAEEGAPVATQPLIDVDGSIVVNDTTIQNHSSSESIIDVTKGASVTLNDGTTIKHCARSNSGTVIYGNGGEVVINEGTLITDNLSRNDAAAVYLNGAGPELTINGGEITYNYSACDSVISVMGTAGAPGTICMNGGVISNNVARIMPVYVRKNAEMFMHGGTISNNITYNYFGIIHTEDNTSYLTIYNGTIINNHDTNNTLVPSVSANYPADSDFGHAELYGGVYSLNKDGSHYPLTLDDICAPGYSVAAVDEDDDGVVDIYKVIKLMTVEYEDVTPADTEGEKLYNINLVTTEGDTINRLNSVDLTFEFDKENDVTYEIIRSNDEIEINPVENSTTRYEFHYNGKDGVTSDTANKINLGQVRFTGYGKFTFSVDESVDTNVAHATTLTDNIVESFAAVNGIDSSIVAGEDYLNIENVIEDVIKLPLRNLAINITFPNNVEFNSEDYQKMTVKVTGGLVNHTFNLGDTSKTETPDDDTDDIVFGPEKSDYTLTAGTVTIPLEDIGGTAENVTVNAYTLNLKLPVNTTYTVEITGDGYRTARYGVALPEDKTLNFWNNVMDTERVIENGLDSSKVQHNFLAGDIVEDNDINIYDLSAVVSYFAKAITDPAEYEAYVKYDLNRDGIIDSKDVAYVLVSWGN